MHWQAVGIQARCDRLFIVLDRIDRGLGNEWLRRTHFASKVIADVRFTVSFIDPDF
ncbi:MAG: hypothetical protein ACJ8MR_09895 [Povalibacter sp.]